MVLQLLITATSILDALAFFCVAYLFRVSVWLLQDHCVFLWINYFTESVRNNGGALLNIRRTEMYSSNERWSNGVWAPCSLGQKGIYQYISYIEELYWWLNDLWVSYGVLTVQKSSCHKIHSRCSDTGCWPVRPFFSDCSLRCYWCHQADIVSSPVTSPWSLLRGFCCLNYPNKSANHSSIPGTIERSWAEIDEIWCS